MNLFFQNILIKNFFKSTRLMLCVVLCNFAVVSFAFAAIFQPGPDMSNERRVIATAAGDLDNDGDIDLITAVDTGPEFLQRRINNGEGKFTTERIGKDENKVLSIALGDIDGDGDLDLMIGRVSRPIKLYLNDGKANFSDIGIEFSAEQFYAKNIALVDIDSDGDLDLVINDTMPPALFMNDGKGHFASSREMGIKKLLGTSFGFADIDGDSDVDLITSEGVVYTNDGKGNFSLKRENTLEQGDLREIILADFDGDGDADLVGTGPYGYALCLNEGNGVFALSTALSEVRKNTSHISAGDVDGDGDLDLLFSNGDSPNELFLNDSRGHFIKSDEQMGSHQFALLLDVDRDQDLDVINLGSGSSILLNQNNKPPLVVLNNLPKTASNAELKLRVNDLEPKPQPPLFVGSLPLILNQHIDHLAAADINKDGSSDLVISSTHNNNSMLCIYVNNGKGELAAPVDIVLNASPTSISFADINNDGFPDLLVSYDKKLNGIFLNNAGHFDGQEIEIGLNVDRTKSILAVDINGDGALDLITANHGQSKRYLNDGTGKFTSGRAINREFSSTDNIVAVDFDGDGNIDLAQGAYDVKVYRGLGDAMFDADGIELLGRTSTIARVYAGDLDADGDIDLLSCGVSINMIRNNGQNNFTVGRDLNAAQTCSLVDIDLDGDLDIVSSYLSSGPMKIVLNDGKANWTSLINVGDIPDLDSFFLVDMDGDGDLDLLTIPHRKNDLIIFPNVTRQGYLNERVAEAFHAGELKKQPEVQSDIEIPESQNPFVRLWRALKNFNNEWGVVGILAVLMLGVWLYRFLRQ